MQLPFVEKMLGELGLDAKTTEGLLSTLNPAQDSIGLATAAASNGHVPTLAKENDH